MLSLTWSHTSLHVSYCFCLVLLWTKSSVLKLLSPSTNIVISPRFLEGMLYSFLDVVKPGWQFSSYIWHKVVNRIRNAKGLCRASARRDRAQSWAGDGGRDQSCAACVTDATHPHLPADFSTSPKPNQISTVLTVMQFSVWSGAGRIAYLNSRRSSSHWLSDTTDAQHSLPPTAISAPLLSLSLSWSIFCNPDLI